MSATDRNKFIAWYESRKDQVFDFAAEMIKYCRSDVDILRKCCLRFREDFLKISEVDPFQHITIASACMNTYRSKFLKANTIGIVPVTGYVNKTGHSVASIQWLDWDNKSERELVYSACKERFRGETYSRFIGRWFLPSKQHRLSIPGLLLSCMCFMSPRPKHQTPRQ